MSPPRSPGTRPRGRPRVRGPGTEPTSARRAREREFGQLSAIIRSCQLCPLGRTRTHAVVYRGSHHPRVLFVGEAPGAEEDRRGVPFVGRSGAILDRAIALLGDGLGDYAIVNVLKCRPPANRFDPAAARTCRPYLDRQIELLRPELLVPLGARALHALAPSVGKVLRTAGRPHVSPYGPLFPLIHPAASLRSRRLSERWQRDVLRLRDWLVRSRTETP